MIPKEPPIRFLREKEVIRRTSLSRTTLWRRVKKKTFPKPIKLSSGRKAWIESEIVEWQKSHLENR